MLLPLLAAGSPRWSAAGDEEDLRLGSSVAPAGDVNGDGFGDVLVGSRGAPSGQARLYLGSPTGLGAGPAWLEGSDQADSLFGAIVSSAGDVDGDGLSDVGVGAPHYDAPDAFEGKVFLDLGRAP